LFVWQYIFVTDPQIQSVDTVEEQTVLQIPGLAEISVQNIVLEQIILGDVEPHAQEFEKFVEQSDLQFPVKAVKFSQYVVALQIIVVPDPQIQLF